MALNSGCTCFNNPASIATIIVSIWNYMKAELDFIRVIASFMVLSHINGKAKECDWKLGLLSEIRFYIPCAKSNEEEKII